MANFVWAKDSPTDWELLKSARTAAVDTGMNPNRLPGGAIPVGYRDSQVRQPGVPSYRHLYYLLPGGATDPFRSAPADLRYEVALRNELELEFAVPLENYDWVREIVVISPICRGGIGGRGPNRTQPDWGAVMRVGWANTMAPGPRRAFVLRAWSGHLDGFGTTNRLFDGESIIDVASIELGKPAKPPTPGKKLRSSAAIEAQRVRDEFIVWCDPTGILSGKPWRAAS